MPQRKIPLLENTFYHVFNRGFNEQTLFFEEKDYERFTQTIERYLDEVKTVEIGSFSILPNHFHLLLTSSESGLKISEFMRKIQQAYAMYFNKKYGDKVKSGLKFPVFEGRFKAKIIEDEEYLHTVSTYIELNAIKHELVSDIKDWPYSSFHFPLIKSGLKK